MAMKKRVVILRGIPGAGKTKYAQKYFPTATRVSADDFFLKPDGTYVWNARLLGAAHRDCLRRFRRALKAGDPLIVVDNTSIRPREIRPYVKAAEAAGYDVEIVTLLCDPAVAIARGTHGVPGTKVEQMARALNDVHLPAEWKHQTIRMDK